MVPLPTADPVYAFLEAQQGVTPWGRVLDAGTGPQSLGWVNTLPNATWTAVTADASMRARTLQQCGLEPDDSRLVLGRWTDPDLLAGQQFDVVVADYLLGALDAFTPYCEDLLWSRLARHLGAAGRLYVIGLEPWGNPSTGAHRAFMDLVALRDATMLLAGQRPYREYPPEHVIRALQRAGLQVVAQKRFPILLTSSMVDRQVGNATRQLCCVPAALKAPLQQQADALQERLHDMVAAGVRFGADYALVARWS